LTLAQGNGQRELAATSSAYTMGQSCPAAGQPSEAEVETVYEAIRASGGYKKRSWIRAYYAETVACLVHAGVLYYDDEIPGDPVVRLSALTFQDHRRVRLADPLGERVAGRLVGVT
jgi:hypothetical protein